MASLRSAGSGCGPDRLYLFGHVHPAQWFIWYRQDNRRGSVGPQHPWRSHLRSGESGICPASSSSMVAGTARTTARLSGPCDLAEADRAWRTTSAQTRCGRHRADGLHQSRISGKLRASSRQIRSGTSAVPRRSSGGRTCPPQDARDQRRTGDNRIRTSTVRRVCRSPSRSLLRHTSRRDRRAFTNRGGRPQLPARLGRP